jgi:hypothetical protein
MRRGYEPLPGIKAFHSLGVEAEGPNTTALMSANAGGSDSEGLNVTSSVSILHRREK